MSKELVEPKNTESYVVSVRALCERKGEDVKESRHKPTGGTRAIVFEPTREESQTNVRGSTIGTCTVNSPVVPPYLETKERRRNEKRCLSHTLSHDADTNIRVGRRTIRVTGKGLGRTTS